MVRRTGVPPFALLGLLAALAAVPLPAQDLSGEPPRLPPRRLLLLFETASGVQLEDSQRHLLYESLLINLGRASERVRVLEGTSAGDDDEARAQAAAGQQADAWIHVRLDGSWESLTIAVRSFDLLRQELRLDYTLKKDLRRGAIDLERRFWDEVARSVRETYTEAGLPITGTVQEVALELQAAPGTRIRGFSSEPLRVGAEGAVTTEVLLPATFEYRATARGYRPLEEMVFLSPGEKSFTLPQERGARWSLDFYLYQFGFPGFDVGFYPKYGSWYVKLGLNTFLAGVTLGGGDEEELFSSQSLSHVNLATGLYLNDADRRFRFYFGAGAFARLITAKDLIVTIDPVAPFGLQPALGLEFGQQPRRRFYLEYAPPFYYAPQVSLMWLSVPTENPQAILPIPFHVVDGEVKALYHWAFMWELVVFRLGVRWVL